MRYLAKDGKVFEHLKECQEYETELEYKEYYEEMKKDLNKIVDLIQNHNELFGTCYFLADDFNLGF